ncbi:MAG: SH3 domain-containing protein [Lentilitoribacter sp.]
MLKLCQLSFKPAVGFVAVIGSLWLSNVTAFASPEPTFTCRIPPGTFLQRDGYSLGENLYVFDNSVALEGYQDPSEQVPYASDEGDVTTYANDQLSIYVSAYGAEIELKSGLLINCEFASQSNDQPAEIINSESYGLSDGVAYESIIREQPSPNGRRLQKLGQYEEIYIVENMGNNYQGFDWFKVEYNRGRNGFVSEAYAWGGTICAAGGPIPGIMQQCP